MTIETPSWQEFNRPRLAARQGMHGMCGIEDCMQPAFKKLPLCESHAWDVWSEMSAESQSLAEKAQAEMRHRQWDEERSRAIRARMDANQKGTLGSDPGLIYYLQVEDQIKIGFTSNLSVRLAAYPPMARLLATHPGTYQTESAMHAKFAQHLAGRKEWFVDCDDIANHIQEVRRTFKQDRRVAA